MTCERTSVMRGHRDVMRTRYGHRCCYCGEKWFDPPPPLTEKERRLQVEFERWYMERTYQIPTGARSARSP